MPSDLVAVLMAGGSGTRFWPLSSPAFPKQFLTSFEKTSLFRQTVERSNTFTDFDKMLVLTNERFKKIIKKQSPEIPTDNVVLEPMRRDTAAAITLAALIVEHLWPESIMVVLPSDHSIRDNAGFAGTINKAAELARENKFVTLGIPPTYPATCYGYLHLDDRIDSKKSSFRLRKFVEKPDLEKATHFLSSAEFLWNSGIFLWRSSVILQAVEEHLPDLYSTLKPLASLFGSNTFFEEARKAFEKIQAISIDFGVMEKIDEIWALPVSFDWSDVGGWKAAKDFLQVGEDGNRIRGKVIAKDCQNNLIISDGENHSVLCMGVEGLVVVSTPEGTLVCREDMIDLIKPHVEKIIG